MNKLKEYLILGTIITILISITVVGSLKIANSIIDSSNKPKSSGTSTYQVPTKEKEISIKEEKVENSEWEKDWEEEWEEYRENNASFEFNSFTEKKNFQNWLIEEWKEEKYPF